MGRAERVSDDLNYVVFTTDGQELWFGTQSAIANHYKTSLTTVRAMLYKQKETYLSTQIERILSVTEHDELERTREKTILTGELIKGRPITIHALDRYTGEIIETFTNIDDAREWCGAKTPASIYAVARGHQKQAHGYDWEIIKDEYVMPEVNTAYRTDKEPKYVVLYNDCELYFSTQNEIAEVFNATRTIVESTLRGNNTYLLKEGVTIFTFAEYEGLVEVREHRFGGTPIKQGHKHRVHMLDRYTHEILDTFDSIKDASDDLSVNASGITRSCQVGGTYAGYKWEYADIAS